MTEETATRTPRKVSRETELKREMARINRELDSLDKKLQAFEEMKAEMENVEQTRETLQSDLDNAKKALIAELGLD